MAERNSDIQSFLRLATDINRNISQMIHLSNNLRYNSYHLLNRNSNALANDIFFPTNNIFSDQILPDIHDDLPLSPTVPSRSRRSRRGFNLPAVRRTITRPRRTYARERRVLPRDTGTFLDNEVFQFSEGATPNEIGSATEAGLYSDISTNQLMCPITQQNFLPTDNVLRIRHCGHVFTADRLRQWFRSHHDCPVCRYNIRSTVSPAIETMLRNIASQTMNATDISNNSTTYEYSVFTSSFAPLNILNNT